MKLTVVGCSPAWPNPGGAQSGYLLEGPGRLLLDCGPGVLARLRSTDSKNGWPHVDAIAITHFHLDHWGDLVPWVWGTMWGLGRDYEKPVLWLPPGGREELAAFGTRFGTPDMFVRVFEPMEYEEGEPFEAAGLELTALRLPHARLLGRFRPQRATGEAGRGRRPLHLRGHARARRARRRAARPPLRRGGGQGLRGLRRAPPSAHAQAAGAQSGRRPRAGPRRTRARDLNR